MNLFVGNLHPETSAASLRTLFSQFGEVLSSKVIMDNATGMSRGFGFVEMGDKYHANDAVDNLDQTFFEGNIISVKEAKQSNTKGGGGSRFGGGGGNRFGGGGGNRSFKPRTPRPGGWDNNSGHGGHSGHSNYGERNSNSGHSSYSERNNNSGNNNNGNGYNNNRY